jgi:hypothetical protein
MSAPHLVTAGKDQMQAMPADLISALRAIDILPVGLKLHGDA